MFQVVSEYARCEHAIYKCKYPLYYIFHMISAHNRNKRNLVIRPVNDLEVSKRIHTPRSGGDVVSSIPNDMNLERMFIAFLNEEIECYTKSRMVLTVYKSTLENVPVYANLFSNSEMNVIFDDIGELLVYEKAFIIKVIQELVSASEFQGQQDEEAYLNMNISHLVYSCDLRNFNLGRILNTEMLNKEKYKSAIIGYLVKLDFVINIVKESISNNMLVENWSVDCSRISQLNGSKMSFETLSTKYSERFARLPSQLKAIIDLHVHSSPLKYDLNLSVIKVNQLLNHAAGIGSIKKWEQLRDFQVDFTKERVGFNNQLEYKIDSPHEFKLSHGPIPAQPSAFEKSLFLYKLKILEDLKKRLKKFGKQVHTFVQAQVKYAQMWNDLLVDDEFFDVIFERYKGKMNSLVSITTNFNEMMTKRLVAPLDTFLGYLQPLKKSGLKAEYKAVLGHMDRFTYIAMADLFKYLRIWLRLFIGKSKIKEFQKLRQTEAGHQDIVRFFLDRTVDHM